MGNALAYQDKKFREVKKLSRILACDPNSLEIDVPAITEFGKKLNYHTATHIVVSRMDPITIAGQEVTGVGGKNGFRTPIYHPFDITHKPEYSGHLDEIRVAVEQFCATPELPAAFGRMVYWSGVMIKNNIDPADVMKQHCKVREARYGVAFGEAIDLVDELKNYSGDITLHYDALRGEAQEINNELLSDDMAKALSEMTPDQYVSCESHERKRVHTQVRESGRWT